jgi:riboflavin biosynthesis pyrimidine reductase
MSQVAVDRPVGLEPLEVLLERAGQAEFRLPGELAELYGGPLGFPEPCLYANFVASVDGVVAIPSEIDSSHAIAAGSQGDRFVMGLLRACADAVLVGAGTLAGSPRTRWTPENAYPPAASLYAELRRLRNRPATPTLTILSGSGRIDPSHPGLAERTLVLTSEQGAARLGHQLPCSATIVPIGDEPPLDPVAAIEALRAGGHELILCEGGPTLFGELAGAGLVDELFLTLSPLLAGRSAADQRLSLVQGSAFLPRGGIGCRLLTLRQAGSHLFLRYELQPAGQVGA